MKSIVLTLKPIGQNGWVATTRDEALRHSSWIKNKVRGREGFVSISIWIDTQAGSKVLTNRVSGSPACWRDIVSDTVPNGRHGVGR